MAYLLVVSCILENSFGPNSLLLFLELGDWMSA